MRFTEAATWSQNRSLQVCADDSEPGDVTLTAAAQTGASARDSSSGGSIAEDPVASPAQRTTVTGKMTGVEACEAPRQTAAGLSAHLRVSLSTTHIHAQMPAHLALTKCCSAVLLHGAQSWFPEALWFLARSAASHVQSSHAGMLHAGGANDTLAGDNAGCGGAARCADDRLKPTTRRQKHRLAQETYRNKQRVRTETEHDCEL